MTDRKDLLQWSFVSLIVGGVLILAASLMMGVMSLWMGGAGGGRMMTMMGPDAYPGPGFFTAAMGWLALWGVLMGAAVLFAAWRVRTAPRAAAGAGMVAIVAGALSLLAMGGWLLGAVAAVGGGVLALLASTREPDALNPRRA